MNLREKLLDGMKNELLSKINYHIHTDAVQKYLITDSLTEQEKGYKFANEADMINVALFGKKSMGMEKRTSRRSKKEVKILEIMHQQKN